MLKFQRYFGGLDSEVFLEENCNNGNEYHVSGHSRKRRDCNYCAFIGREDCDRL